MRSLISRRSRAFTHGQSLLARCQSARPTERRAICRFACRVGYFMRTMQTTILRWLGMGPAVGRARLRLHLRLAQLAVIPAVCLPALEGGSVRSLSGNRCRSDAGGNAADWYETPAPLPERNYNAALNRFGPPPPKNRPSCHRADAGVCGSHARKWRLRPRRRASALPDRSPGLLRRFRPVAPAGYDGSFAARPE